VNTKIEDYFDTKPVEGHGKCIGCAKCVSPAKGKLVEYRYPKNLESNNHRQFARRNLSQLDTRGDPIHENLRISWDYDRIKRNIKAETKQDMLPEPKMAFETTNQLMMKGKFLMPHRKNKQELLERMGDRVQINCFSDITTNKMKFVGGDNPIKQPSFKLPNAKVISH